MSDLELRICDRYRGQHEVQEQSSFTAWANKNDLSFRNVSVENPGPSLKLALGIRSGGSRGVYPVGVVTGVASTDVTEHVPPLMIPGVPLPKNPSQHEVQEQSSFIDWRIFAIR